MRLAFAFIDRPQCFGRAQRRICRVAIGAGKGDFGGVQVIEIGQDQTAMIFRQRIERAVALQFVKGGHGVLWLIKAGINPCLGQRHDQGGDPALRQGRYGIKGGLIILIADFGIHHRHDGKQVFGIFIDEHARNRFCIGNAAFGDQGQKGAAAQIIIFRVDFMGAQQIARGIIGAVFDLGGLAGKEIAREAVALRIFELGTISGLRHGAAGRKGKSRHRNDDV